MSVFPHYSTLPCSDVTLISADGSSICSWGKQVVPLKFGNHCFSWSFRLAAVDRPILGADFLADKRLLVDVANRRLLVSDSLQPLSASPPPAGDSSLRAALISVPGEFRSLLSEFPDVIKSSLGSREAKHSTCHHVITTGPAVFAKARRLDPGKLQAAKAEFAAMEIGGIIRCSNSAWATPLHMVPKPDGSWRP